MESRKPIGIALGVIFFSAAAPAVIAADYHSAGTEQPRISEREARELGLDRVPQGTVRAARLEQRDGRLVWFLDIAGYNNRSRQEMLVDASDGRVLESHARALEGPPRTERNSG